MKTKTIFKIALSVALLIGIYFLSSWLYGKDKSYKSGLETANNELSVLKVKNTLLEQDTAKLNISIDSLSRIISKGKIDISKEREKRKLLKEEMLAELDNMIESTDEENVEYFIASTYQDYPVKKYMDFYLVNIGSIKFANNALANLEYMEEENLSFIDEIQALNKLISDYDYKSKDYDIKFLKMNGMINNRDAAIANKNIQIALNDGHNKKLKSQRNLIGIAAVLITIFK